MILSKKILVFTSITLITLNLITENIYARDHIVKVISDYDNARMYFEPENLVINSDDTVTWVNSNDDFHNVVTFPDGFPKGAKGFTSPNLTQKGNKWSYSFNTPGTYNYHCIPHLFMGMRGSITVNKASKPDEYHTPSKKEILTYRDQLLQFFDEEDFLQTPDYIRIKEKANYKE